MGISEKVFLIAHMRACMHAHTPSSTLKSSRRGEESIDYVYVSD
jgi:hypothetical protein